MNKVILSVVLVSCLALFSCQQKPAAPSQVVPVNLFTVKAQQAYYYDKFPSTSEALSQVNLLPQVPGYIRGIFFKEGTHIHKGDKLYEIDRQLYQEAYDQAEDNLKVAQGNQVQAQQDADRYTYLNTYDAIAKQTLDHAVIALQNAKSSVAAAEQTLKTAQTNLSYSVITAPFDGTIGFSQVKLGDYVVVGQTVLNTISTDNPMAVDFLINEKQLLRYENIEKGKGNIPDSLFTIILPDDSIYPYQGKLSVIDRAVDPQTGTVRVRIEFANPDYSLRAGMSCVLRVHNQDNTPQLIIPNKAIVEQMGEYFVFVAKDTIITDTSHKQAADTAQQRPKLIALEKKVQLGQVIGANVIVRAGIKEGDKVVVDGVQTLHDGSRITTSNKPQGAQQGGTGRQDKQGGGTKDSTKNGRNKS